MTLGGWSGNPYRLLSKWLTVGLPAACLMQKGFSMQTIRVFIRGMESRKDLGRPHIVRLIYDVSKGQRRRSCSSV